MATTLDPIEKLYALYNQNRFNRGLMPIIPAEFEMQEPIVYSGPRSPKNTKIQLIPKTITNVFGTINFFYDREDMATSIINPKITKGTLLTIHEALPDINNELGVILYTSDVLNGPLGTTGFTLTAKPTNLVFTGSVNFTYYP